MAAERPGLLPSPPGGTPAANRVELLRRPKRGIDSVPGMVLLPRGVAVVCAALLLTSCSAVAAGYAETDRQSVTLADAISYPRQADAAGFARAALATPLGRSGDFSVLEAKDLDHKDSRAMARLVWRIHHAASEGGWTRVEAFDACYSVEFTDDEVSYGPVRITCPDNAVAITPPPLPRRGIPPEFDPALNATLTKLPGTPTEADVRAALATGLPTPPVDPGTHLAGISPEIFVQVRGSDVGVALFARIGVEDKECMMGRRAGGVVTVWSLNWRDLGPREKPCSPQAALAGP
ncbi:hypothetical protein ORV05_09010 [Amycolatopsis cynarae]|uniref:Uncharacterized protein n=1 Tax=Amycolatopsis cynarae TaxID=2995223 RepID=A0ABY7B6C4_9PSEU|nr:hypothetical protein [Amycolatopsis sp. HUAS 11-8]WAL67892.1 hypothetical protein ORV05_09010 [Amycolatopsis sp. HUAS 11-8]